MENTTVEVPSKFKSLVEAIETMSVLDLNELVKLLEKKFGVSAQATASAAPAAAVVQVNAADDTKAADKADKPVKAKKHKGKKVHKAKKSS